MSSMTPRAQKVPAEFFFKFDFAFHLLCRRYNRFTNEWLWWLKCGSLGVVVRARLPWARVGCVAGPGTAAAAAAAERSRGAGQA